MRHAILVVGTGRCGTSAMTGTLQLLGACLGEKLTAADVNNRKGYFENADVTSLNKRLLSEVGVLWYQSPAENAHAVPVTASRCDQIRAHVTAVFGDKSPIAIKDPRLCVLFDVYVSALRAMAYEVHCIRMRRDVHDVVWSIRAAAGGDERHLLSTATRYAELLDTAIKSNMPDLVDCTFTDLVEDTKATVRRLMDRFPFLMCSTEVMDEVLGFIDSSLKHR